MTSYLGMLIVLPTLQDFDVILLLSYPLRLGFTHFTCSLSLLEHLCQLFLLLRTHFPSVERFGSPDLTYAHIALALFCHARYR
jgi:hypothetical protein